MAAVALILTSPLWVPALTWHLAYHPSPLLGAAGMHLMFALLLLVLADVAALAVILVAVLMLYRREYPRVAKVGLALAVLFLISSFVGIRLGVTVWRERVRRVVIHSKPLVAAIHAFENANGRPPASLDELVPVHLPAVPETSIGIHPRYKYVVGQPGDRDGNPWALTVTPPCVPGGFDVLMYFPQQNYPERGYGGRLERVEDWAYVRE